jgi:SAM-dependent methyltransferase
MAQNIYDYDEFFKGYSQLERSISGLAGAPEWPSLRVRIPDLKDKHVLDLGCGFGWFCRWAAEEGAASVLGLDLSENMLARARTSTRHETIAYRQTDLDSVVFSKGDFDFAYSSLALHYLENLDKLFLEISRALAPDGEFVFSVEHPLVTAPSKPAWLNEKGRAIWPTDDYLSLGSRTTDWLAPGVIKQHRTLASYLNSLIGAGFRILHVEEWGPSEAQIAVRPEWAKERHRPPFLLVHAKI